jgi:S-adenosylmethionine hydrolase
MYGVALSVDEELRIFDLTHEIPPFDIFEGSYRLLQAVPYWPANTVFVSVVDPGVGTRRRSCAARTARGQIIITPDNGTLSHIARTIGITEVREISEAKGHRKGSSTSNTFHGRDIYAYTGALLASGRISFEEIGEAYDPSDIVMLEDLYPSIEGDTVSGTIETLDVRFGSLWTSISKEFFEQLDIRPGETADVTIMNGKIRAYRSFVTYAGTFNDVEIGEALLYVNSMEHIALAINQGNFARAYNIGTRSPWRILIRKVRG